MRFEASPSHATGSFEVMAWSPSLHPIGAKDCLLNLGLPICIVPMHIHWILLSPHITIPGICHPFSSNIIVEQFEYYRLLKVECALGGEKGTMLRL